MKALLTVIIKIFKSIGLWFANKMLSIFTTLLMIILGLGVAIIGIFVILGLFVFGAKIIYGYFGLGWMFFYTFVGISFLFSKIIYNSSYGGGYSSDGGRSSDGYGDGHSENAPYQGDRSMVGGVVGGSITHPVGGRAGQ